MKNDSGASLNFLVLNNYITIYNYIIILMNVMLCRVVYREIIFIW